MKKMQKVLVLLLVIALMSSPLVIHGVASEENRCAAANTNEVIAPISGDWTVTFETHGGTDVPTIGVDNNRLIRKPSSPTRHGYVFVHWFRENDFTAPRWNFATDRVTGNVTLHAMWAEVEAHDWVLKYHEAFNTDFNAPLEWSIDDYSNQSHPIWGNNGLGFLDRERRMLADGRTVNPEDDFATRLANITEFRKSHTFGEDGWLTVQQYTRYNDSDILQPEGLGGRFVVEDGWAVVKTEHHQDAATIASTNALPPVYRIQVTVSGIDAGGRNIDPITGREIANTNNTVAGWTDERGFYNGLPPIPGTTTQPHRSTGPWGVNVNTNVQGNASTNGMYFLAVVDYSNPKPNNNLFIHHRRKVVMDVNSHRSSPWSGIWCPVEERHVMDGSRYVSMLWLSGGWRDQINHAVPGTRRPSPNQMTLPQFLTWFQNGNPFFSYTQVGQHYQGWDNFMVDKYLPDEAYTFTIERTPEYFYMSVSGYFAIGGYRTYSHTKFHLPDNDPTSPRYNMGIPTWRFNQTPEELQGWVPPSDIVRFDDGDGNYMYYETWGINSYNPEYFFFGIPHVNHYVASAKFTDVKMWVPGDRSELHSVIEEANLLGRENFSPANWRLFEPALTHAQNVYNNPNATQAEINHANNIVRNILNRATFN